MTTAPLKVWWLRRRSDVAALAAVALAFCAAFGWAVFRGKFLIGGDVFFYTYPMRTVAWRMIRAGTPPVWTPLVLSGYPLLAMVQLGLGYPLTWLHLFLPDHWAEEIYVLAPFLLAPAFTYAYVREIGRSRLAALLAALAFGYGGLTTNTLGMNGIPTNGLMWLPLVLVALERARTRPVAACLIGATVPYALSVLSGHAQSFLMVGFVALGYALFLGFAQRPGAIAARTWRSWPRWRPLFVAAGAMGLSFGVAAFQLLETLQAARRSIRHEIGYDFFSQGSFTFREALLSFAAPLYHYIDVTTYVAPLACALALYAVIRAVRRKQTSDPRIWFWFATAVFAFVFMLGEHTPIYRLAYHVPVLNLFRIPSRHTFEWTFALAVLAAYGWDALLASSHARLPDTNDSSEPTGARERRQFLIDAMLLALAALVGALWLLAVNRVALFGLLPVAASGRAHVVWKLMFTIVVLVVVWRGRRVGATHWREGLLACALILGCLIEPLVLISQWWPGTAKPAARFTTPGLATRYLQQFPPEANRVYTHVNLGVDENADTPRFDVLDQTALYGLQNAGGYEALLLERYSRALGDVDYDAVRPRPGHLPPLELFGPQSHVLDLLNVTHVVTLSELSKQPGTQLIQHDGVGFAPVDLAIELKPGASTTINVPDSRGETLALVTSLANSVELEQGAPVVRVHIFTADGRMVERTLRAGLDTAEWAHERPDVRASLKHQLAPVFDSRAGDAANSYPANRYWTSLQLGALVTVTRLEITNVTQTASLALWKATLYDAATKQSTPLTNRPATSIDPARWEMAAEFDGVFVLHNMRALPRAWLVTEAEAVDSEEALRRIRGEGAIMFDPRRTALLEVGPTELPPLPGGDVSPQSAARITSYEPNHLVIETSAPTTTVLVVSEIFYPGWIASVDGQPIVIHRTDYLLRGVPLPAGRHKVEMRYAAPAARNGAIISTLTLLVLCSLAVNARRHRNKEKKATQE